VKHLSAKLFEPERVKAGMIDNPGTTNLSPGSNGEEREKKQRASHH
jgi:hypothetical protein